MDVTPGAARRTAAPWATLAAVVLAAACYTGIVAVRGGPPAGGDTVPLVAVTTALSHGDLRAAAADARLPDPPGYPLLAAPLVALLRPVLGAPVWCTPPDRLPAAVRHRPALAGQLDMCGVPAVRPDGRVVAPPVSWWRGQGVLGLAAWLVLAAGALLVLSAAGVSTPGRRFGLLAFLVVLPAASGAMVQYFHPQDTVSLGLALAGAAMTLRRRWLLAGVLFGAAVATKQFAVLVLLPALAAAPGARPRLRLGVAAAAVAAAVVAPFVLADPGAAWQDLSGTGAGGAVAGTTVLSLAGATGPAASAVARDAPVLFALVLCLVVGWAARPGGLLARPAAFTGLILACLASRLVFESAVFPYYLLAASVAFFLCDLAARRTPWRSIAWSAAAAVMVATHAGGRWVLASVTLGLALVAVGDGLSEVVAAGDGMFGPWRARPPDPAGPGAPRPT